MLIQRPASMSSMLHSMNVVREVPVRLLRRSTVKISQKRTMPITTQLFSDQWMFGLQEDIADLRCPERKTRNDGQLFRLAHLQLPNGSDWKCEDEQIRQDVRRDQRLEDKDLVHAMSDAL